MTRDSFRSPTTPLVSRRRILRGLLVTGGVATLAACSPAAPAPSVAPAPTSAPVAPTAPPAAPATAPVAAPTAAAAQPTAAPKPAAPTQAPTAKPAPVKIILGQATSTLSQSPLHIAIQRGYFKDEALDLDQQLLSSGAIVSTALVNDELQFGEFGSSDVITANDKGLGFMGVSQLAGGLTQTFAIRKDYAASKGLTPQQPLQQRVQGLKGARIGLSSAAGAPTQYTKYILKQYGLDPDKDVEMSVVGSGPSRRAALKNNQVDLFLGGVPDAEVTEFEGYGLVFIRPGDEVPIFKDFAWEVIAVKAGYAEKNPGVVERFARAVARGSNYIKANPAEAKKVLKTPFADVDEKVISLAIDNVINAFPVDGKMTEAQWKNAAQVLVEAAAISKMPNTTEGVFWTNKFIKDIPKT